jgi:N-methylhydantoinase B
MHRIDAIKLEVIKNALFSVAEEMGAALIRTAYSTNIKDRRDCSCGIYTKDGDLVSQAEHIPLHLGFMNVAVKNMLKYVPPEEYEPGDALICNYPYITGSHKWDVLVMTPVFYKGEMVGIVANIAHHVDIGGIVSHIPTDVYEEGLCIPPMKIMKKGKLNEELMKIIRWNVRVDEVIGDLMAQLAANKVGEKRYIELIERFGLETIQTYTEELINYAERLVRTALERMPKGKATAEDYIEGDGISDRLFKIRATVEIKNNDFYVDFTGTDRMAEGYINAPYGDTLSCVGYVVKCITDPDAPSNAGVYKPIHLTAPEGTLVNAISPAPVNGANIITCQRIVDVILEALAQIVPEKVCAPCSGSMNAIFIHGFDPRFNCQYAYIETYAGGWGAMIDHDGLDATHTHMTNTMNAPVEAIEIAYPLQVLKYGIIPNSGGRGKYRGGVGVTREIMFVNHTAFVGVMAERVRIRPQGLFGGQAARGSRVYKVKKDGSIEELPSKCQGVKMLPGERLVLETAGGGGWGDPEERDPKLIEQDILYGFVTKEQNVE